MNRSEQLGKLITALAKAQANFGAATKDSDNPFYKSKYADLASVINAVRKPLNEQGIAILHTLESDLERRVAVVTVGLYHEEQFMEITVEAPAVSKSNDGKEKFDVQTLGAAWSYLRRYSLQAICGLASEDDDGNSLQNDNKPIASKKAPQKPVKEQLEESIKAEDQATVVRAQFFAKVKEAGWQLNEVKDYIKQVFGTTSTKELTEKQLTETIEALSQVSPAEFFNMPPVSEEVASV